MAAGEAPRPERRRVEGRTVDTAGRVLASAFVDDPGYLWVEPDEARRVRLLSFLYGRMVIALARLDETWSLSSDAGAPEAVHGVAAWWPPGRAVGLVQLLSTGMAALPFHVGAFATTRAVAALGAMDRAHARAARGAPHWFLDHLGVAPVAQGRGLGRRLVEEQLRRADAERVPALLHTSKERNVRFYGAMGFDTVEEQRVGGERGFRLWTMRREVPANGA